MEKKKKKKFKYHDNDKLKSESEYNNGQLIKEKIYKINGDFILDTEYMNDKNLWKTKEYRNFELIFGGECEKSLERLIRWNGNGKEFDRKGKLIFEGEYFEGKRWNGKGKEYNNKND